MPRRCTVCDHPERHGIDEALVSGTPYRSVAKRSGLSESAVYRHKGDNLPAHLFKARKPEEMAQADNCLGMDERSVRTKQKACKVCLHRLRESIEHDLFLVGRGPGYLADCVRDLIRGDDIRARQDSNLRPSDS